MALESVTNIADLVMTNPTATDPKSEGDDHIRNIKKALKTDLPNITGPITATQAELNVLDGITTNGLIARTAVGTGAVRTLTAGDHIVITNGDGVSGNPVIGIDPNDLPSNAVLVNYTPEGSGAVTTTVQNKLQEVVSVQDFGASPSASAAVNTSAFQAAIDSLTAGTVIVPTGTYSLNTVTLKPGVSLKGDGPLGVNLSAAANSTIILSYVASGSIQTGFTVSGLRFLCGAFTGCTAISIDGNTSAIRCSKVRIENVDIEGAFDFGVVLRFCANTFINNVFCSGVADGVYIDNCADTDITSVKVQNGSNYGFYINGGGGAFDEGVRLISCSTNGQTYGLGINGQDWGVASGCSFTTAPSGALVASSATNWKFSSTEFAVGGVTPGNAGVSLNASCVNFSFSSCQISNNTFGMVLRGSGHTVNGCYFTANSNTDLTLDGALYSTIADSVFRSSGSGIVNSVLEENAANYNVITGNSTNLDVTLVGADSIKRNNVGVTTSVAETDFPAGSVSYTPAGTGAVATTVQSKLREWVSVKDFGADPGASAAVNTAAIQAAADYADSVGAYLGGAPGTYSINNTITLKCSGDLGEMTLSVAGASLSGPAVLVGSTDSNSNTHIHLVLPSVNNTSQTGNNWSGAGSYPGIELANLYYSKVTVNYIRGFLVGLDCSGYGFGFSGNTLLFSASIQDNQVGLRVQPKGADGWANDNLFLAPNIRVNSNFGSEVAGIRNIQILPFDVTNSATSWPNQNIFIKPVLEGNPPEFHIEVAGTDNSFISPRLETILGVTQKIRLTGNASVIKTAYNTFTAGYLSATTVFSTSGLVGGTLVQTSGRNSNDSITSLYPIFSFANSASNAAPIIRLYPSGKQTASALSADTDWTFDQSATVSSYKATAAAHPALTINHGQGTLSFGDGTVAPTKSITGSSTGLRVNSDWWPSSDNTRTLGLNALRWSNTYSTNFRPGAGTATWTSGAGSPEGVLTALVGSLYTRTDGGAGTTLYVKETGTGNTGWVAK